MQELGYNYRITDLQCALGVSQLQRLDDFVRRRQEIVDRYNAAFAGYAAPAYPSSHTNYPYAEFGKYSDAAMPRAYWNDSAYATATTPTQMEADLDSQWKTLYSGFVTAGKTDSQRPIVPIARAYNTSSNSVSGSSILTFVNALTSDTSPAFGA